jgi:hypothetical protein
MHPMGVPLTVGEELSGWATCGVIGERRFAEIVDPKKMVRRDAGGG